MTMKHVTAERPDQRAQKKPTPRKAVASSQALGVGHCNGDSNGSTADGNDDSWKPSELDDQRWTLGRLLDLGEISSEERPATAGGALMVLARRPVQ